MSIPKNASLDSEIIGALRTRRPAMLARLIDVYLDFAPSAIAVMRSAIAEKHAGSLGAAAHSLKSSSANLGAIRISESCRQLEVMAREVQLDGCDKIVVAIEQEFLQVQRLLGELGKPSVAAITA